MMRSETVRWGKKLQPSFTSNAKNVVKCASGGGECRYMRHARCYMRHANVNVPSLATSHHPPRPHFPYFKNIYLTSKNETTLPLRF